MNSVIKLVATILVLVLALSLIPIAADNLVSANPTGQAWTKYSGQLTMQNQQFVADAWVIKDGATYKMWFTRLLLNEPEAQILARIDSMDPDLFLSDLLAKDYDGLFTRASGLTAADVVGLLDSATTVIGYAESANGITWTVQNANVLAGGGSILTGVGAPTVVKTGVNSYEMWYTWAESDLDVSDWATILGLLAGTQANRKTAVETIMQGVRTVIGHATSADGITWVGASQVFPKQAAETGVGGSVGAPCVIKDGATYKMWYTRAESDLTVSQMADAITDTASIDIDTVLAVLDGTAGVIGHATSNNGTDWTVGNPEALTGNGALWDSVGDPCVVKVDGTYHMWYTGARTNLTSAGVGTIWSELLTLNLADIWNALAAQDLGAILNALLAVDLTTIKNTLANTGTDIGYATSSNGVTWAVQNAADLVGSSGSPWSSVGAPSVIESSGSYEMWFSEGISDLTVGKLIDLYLGSDFPIGRATAESGTGEVTLLGPTQYIRTKGKPNVYTDEFPGVEGEGKLTIVNGDEAGGHRVSSALVSVNGQPVFGTSDFNQRVGALEATVDLAVDNSISVELRSEPGSYLTVQVTQAIAAEAGAVIGPEGGVVEVIDPDSPILGAKLVIPDGAVEQDVVITLSEGIDLGDPEFIGIPISCNPDGYSFNKEVALTIPLREPSPSDELTMLLVYNEANANYEYAGRLVEVHGGATELTVGINHFSSFVFMRTTSYFAGLPSVITLVPTLMSVGSAIAAGNSSELSVLRQELVERRDYYYGVMRDYSEAHGWCSTTFGFDDFVEKASSEVYGLVASTGLAELLGVSATTAGISTVLMIPALAYWGLADTCFLVTSWMSPGFLDAWAGYTVSELGLGIIDKALACAEISYDDGSVEFGWGSSSSLHGTAVLFTPPTTPWTLSSMRVQGWYVGDDAPFYVEIWDENRNELFRGTYMYSDYFNTGVVWPEIDTPDIEVTGDFYVCVFPNDVWSELWIPIHALWMSCDGDLPHSGRSYDAFYTSNTLGSVMDWDWITRATGCP